MTVLRLSEYDDFKTKADGILRRLKAQDRPVMPPPEKGGDGPGRRRRLCYSRLGSTAATSLEPGAVRLFSEAACMHNLRSSFASISHSYRVRQLGRE